MRVGPSVPKPLISISFDICDSTDAKSRIVERNQSDAAQVRADYEHILRQLYAIESEFYAALLGSHQTGSSHDRLSRSDVFLVKTIGDEVWAVVEVEPDTTDAELTKRAYVVLRAALVAVGREVVINGTTLKIRGFVDLLTETVESTALRTKEFQGLCNAEIAANPSTPRDQVAKEVYDRLAGAVTVQAGYPKSGVATRADFIGLEVDRFFRCTKFAHKGALAIGESLANRLTLEASSLPLAEDETKEVTLSIPTGPASAKFERLILTRETATKRQLKGISKSYALYHVEDPTIRTWCGSPDTF